MKKSRKLISLLMALAMIFALAIPAFATTTAYPTDTPNTGTGSITITNAVEYETYSIYQMLSVIYNDTKTAYSYTALKAWVDFFKNDDVAKLYFDIDDQNYVTLKAAYDTSKNGTDMTADQKEALAKAALAYAQSERIEPTAYGDADASGIEFLNLPLGYYLVDTSLGALCSIDTTNPSVNIQEKNYAEIIPSKTVKEDDDEETAYAATNTAGIGEVVDYKVTLANVSNKSNVVVTDTLSEGLTLNGNDNTGYVTVMVGRTTVPATETDGTVNYTVDVKSSTSGTTLKIAFEDSYLASLPSGSTIVITYSATVNEKAVIGYGEGNGNNVVVEYGNSQETQEQTTTTYTYDFDLQKVDGNGNELNGATFKLSTSADGEAIKFVDVVNTTVVGEETVRTVTYRVATEDEISSGYTTDIEVGSATISGLDAGTYYLTEIDTPDGYNSLSSPVVVVISENGVVSIGENSDNNGEYKDNTVVVTNNSGSELPSTGGMGTTLFYIFGGAMVLCAVVLLVTRRRMDNEQ